MPAETTASGLSRRVASLSPGQRTALRRYVAKTAARTSTVEEIPLQPRGEVRDFPLSTAQERMWFNHQWSPDQPLYNESFALRITGDLDPVRLEKSFDFVMACHEIFSVTFHAEQGRLFQRLAGCEAPRLAIRDLRELPEEVRERTFEAESNRVVREPYGLSTGPLFRTGLWCTGRDEYRLIFAMHHIMFDGWSGALFFRELFTAYNALAAGKDLQVPPARAQYVDFAVWERKHFEESAPQLEGQLEYWKGQLAGTLSPVQLPLDRHARGAGAHRAGREVFVCPAAAVAALKATAQESGATLFMALLAIFNLLLARYSGQDDIIVGLPTVNRTHSALSDIIGAFINMALFRTDLSGEITFRELLGRVRETALSAQANQEVPLENVIRALGLKGNAGRSLVNVLFDLQKKPQSLVEVPGLNIQSIEAHNGLAKFDLVLSMEDSGEELKGILEYDAEKFEAETARDLARRFCLLMEAAAMAPDAPAGRLAMVGPEETGRLELRGYETPAPCQEWPHAAVCVRAAERPQALALTSGTERWTYGELVIAARRLAAFLEPRQAVAGKHVALCLVGGPDLVIAQLAVMMSGAVFVPIDPADPPARTDFILRDCGAVVTITNSKSSSALPAWASSICLDRDRAAIARCEPLHPKAQIRGSDPAYLLYTSGSTGQPKGVLVPHAGLANLVAWHRRVFAISTADRATQLASVAFDASIWEIWPYLAAGASVHFPPRKLMADSSGLRDWLVKNKITVSFAPTPLAEELVALDWPANGKLRFLLTGGDRLRRRPSTKLPFAFVNNYGPTENIVVTTSGAVSNTGDTAPSIGGPIDNVWLRVVDGYLESVPPGVPGELIAGGGSLAIGYWQRPELTAEKFITMPDGRRGYRTGDLCRVGRNGEIEFLGRMDAQMKLRGCRVEPGEIENALIAHPGVRDAVVDVRESEGGRSQIVAYFVPEEMAPAAERLRCHLLDRLPSYMIPAHFVAVPEIPKTVSGKVDRKRLPAPEAADRAKAPGREPHTETEKRIAVLWQRTLRNSTPTVDDDFFQCGGDSLLATRLVVSIREEFGVEVPLARMMSEPTIAGLASYVETGGAIEGTIPNGVVLLKSGRGSAPPLFLAPPAAGSPACYVALVAALRGDRAVYGFEAPGLVSGKPISDIPNQARYYILGLKAIQPQGPYCIAGWSLGGPVAFEIACQLREAGEEIAHLSLMDAGLPQNGRLPGGLSWMRPLWWALSFPFAERIPINYATLHLMASWVGIRLPESAAVVWRGGVAGAARFMGGILAGGWRSIRVFLASVRSLKQFEPRLFDGTVTLFQTALHGDLEDRDQVLPNNLRKWSNHVEVFPAPGSHMTLLLDPKIASSFAPQFEAALNSPAVSSQER